MNKEYLTEEIKRLKDLYYSTKQQTNHTTDPDRILYLWAQADIYWNEAHELEKILNNL